MRIPASKLLIHRNFLAIPTVDDFNPSYDEFTYSNMYFEYVKKIWIKEILKILDQYITNENSQSMVLDWIHKSSNETHDIEFFFQRFVTFLTTYEKALHIIRTRDFVLEIKLQWAISSIYIHFHLSPIERFKSNILSLFKKNNVFWIILHRDKKTKQFFVDRDCLMMIKTHHLTKNIPGIKFSYIFYEQEQWKHAGNADIDFRFM